MKVYGDCVLEGHPGGAPSLEIQTPYCVGSNSQPVRFDLTNQCDQGTAHLYLSHSASPATARLTRTSARNHSNPQQPAPLPFERLRVLVRGGATETLDSYCLRSFVTLVPEPGVDCRGKRRLRWSVCRCHKGFQANHPKGDVTVRFLCCTEGLSSVASHGLCEADGALEPIKRAPPTVSKWSAEQTLAIGWAPGQCSPGKDRTKNDFRVKGSLVTSVCQALLFSPFPVHLLKLWFMWGFFFLRSSAPWRPHGSRLTRECFEWSTLLQMNSKAALLLIARALAFCPASNSVPSPNRV
jgi:hypothetical protein